MRLIVSYVLIERNNQMQDKIEKLIKSVYRKWRAGLPQAQEPHPDEESIACFLEDRLSQEENERIITHLIGCDECAENIAAQLKLTPVDAGQVPAELLSAVKNLVSSADKIHPLEIALRFKEKFLEIINTTGDCLVGQELVPAPVLRSRKLKDFKDEVIILKDFQNIRVEAKIENKVGAFNLTVMVKEKTTQKFIQDLRITLLKDDLELESYHTDLGRVTFEHVLLGKYTVEISNIEEKLASILLDIKT